MKKPNRDLGAANEVHAAYELPELGKMFVPLGDVCHASEEATEKLMEFPRTPFAAGQHANRT